MVDFVYLGMSTLAFVERAGLRSNCFVNFCQLRVVSLSTILCPSLLQGGGA
jgi:hypothetical protein